MVGAAEQEVGMMGELERQFWKEESQGKRPRVKSSCVAAVTVSLERSKVCRFLEFYPRGAFEGVRSVFMRNDMVRETGKGGF